MPEVISDANIYLQGLLKEIEYLKSKKRSGLYRINDEVSDRVIRNVQRYFTDKPEYEMSARKCARCSNKWDVIITFKTAP